MKTLWPIFCLFAVSCVTTAEHMTKYANGVTYLAREEAFLAHCKELGVVIGRPSSMWGGKIGNAQARIELVDRAKEAGATHVLETSANWADGNVSGQAYKCPGTN
jgi:hypothetical protein